MSYTLETRDNSGVDHFVHQLDTYSTRKFFYLKIKYHLNRMDLSIVISLIFFWLLMN